MIINKDLGFDPSKQELTINGEKYKITGDSSAINQLAEDVGENTTAINGLSGRMDTVENNISNVSSNIQNIWCFIGDGLSEDEYIVFEINSQEVSIPDTIMFTNEWESDNVFGVSKAQRCVKPILSSYPNTGAKPKVGDLVIFHYDNDAFYVVRPVCDVITSQNTIGSYVTNCINHIDNPSDRNEATSIFTSLVNSSQPTETNPTLVFSSIKRVLIAQV